MVRVFVCVRVHVCVCVCVQKNQFKKVFFSKVTKKTLKNTHVNCCANTNESYVPSVQPLTLHLLKCPMARENTNEGSVFSVQPLTLQLLKYPIPRENTNEGHASAFSSATDITLTLTTCLNVPYRGKIQTLSVKPLTLHLLKI